MDPDQQPAPEAGPAAAQRGDAASLGIVAAVFVATTALAAQFIAWTWQAPHELDGTSTWRVLATLAAAVGQVRGARWLAVGCSALVALATLGLVRRRGWGLVLALPCSAALISCAVLSRYLAVFSEPRQFVARSHYVHAMTVVALVASASHGVALILAARLARRRPVPVALVRTVLGVLALLIATVPAIWIDERFPGGARNAVIAGACAAAALAALITCGVPRRATLLAARIAGVAALAALATGVVLHLSDPPRRGGLYSRAAERAIAEVAFAAPLVIAVVALGLVLRVARPAAPSEQVT